MDLLERFHALPLGARFLIIAGFATAGHLTVRLLRWIGQSIIEPHRPSGLPLNHVFATRHPKLASITSLVVSAFTFIIYFLALGLFLAEMGISLTAYLATASVVGLAVAFGSQGLVQDIVTGLTLTFSNVYDIGDIVEVSGQIGRVEHIGLRFTKLVNLHNQRIAIPNRNIAVVATYRRGSVRAYVDADVPSGAADDDVRAIVERVARGMHAQHRALIMTEPEVFGVFTAGEDGWRYVRIRFRLWPGQAALIENTYRTRLLAALRARYPDYADWMIAITWRVA